MNKKKWTYKAKRPKNVGKIREKIKDGKTYYNAQIMRNGKKYGKELKDRDSLDQYMDLIWGMLESDQNPDNLDITLGECMELFFKKYSSYELSPSSIEKYESLYNNHIKHFDIIDIPIIKIHQGHLNDLFTHDDFITKSDSIKKNCLKVLTHAFKVAQMQSIRVDGLNPCRGYKIPVNPNKKFIATNKHEKIKVFTKDELNTFFKCSLSNMYHDFFQVCYYTGCRFGEVGALTFDSLDFENNTVTINKSYRYEKVGDEYITHFKPTKNKTNRTLHMDNRIKPILKKLYNKQREIQLKNSSYNPNDLIFTNGRGNWLDKKIVMKNFKKILKVAELPNELVIHSLRHSFSTHLIQSNVPIQQVSTILGHSSIKITEQTYSHVKPVYFKSAYENLI